MKKVLFISLKGKSGIIVGVYALLAGFFTLWVMDFNYDFNSFFETELMQAECPCVLNDFIYITISIALATAILAFATSVILTTHDVKKERVKFRNRTTKAMMFSLLVPLLSGAVLSLVMLINLDIYLLPSITLIFYGLALLNTSLYTSKYIRNLGLVQVCLGVLSATFPVYGLLFWMTGFGLAHIIYGIKFKNILE